MDTNIYYLLVYREEDIFKIYKCSTGNLEEPYFFETLKEVKKTIEREKLEEIEIYERIVNYLI